MADLGKLSRLFQAVAARDWAAAEAAASDIASSEEKIGHHIAAQRLRGALQPNGRSRGAGMIERDQPSPETSSPIHFLSDALTQLVADRDLADVHLKSSSRVQLCEVVSEWEKREKLKDHGLLRRTKLLFHGPPGCGKSVAARALARELGLPIYVVRFDAVVGAYLGQTALHLRQLFRFAEATASILLIDEIDALGKRRGNPLDVGELDRVVIALLQELEHSQPTGLLVATSNLARHLDDALWRRFDLVVEFPTPTKNELRAFSLARAASRGVSVTSKLAASIQTSKSYAEAERLIDAEERRQVLRAP